MKSALRVGCIVGILAVVHAAAAPRTSPLIGRTREQVVDRLGDPDGDIVAGPREVLVYSTQRVVLQAGRVVGVEAVAPEVTPPPPPPPPPVAASVPTTAPVQPAAAAVQPAAALAVATPAAAPAAGSTTPNPSPAVTPQETPPPQVIIKSIRPPSAYDHLASGDAPVLAAPVPPAPTATATASTEPANQGSAAAKIASLPPSPAAVGPANSSPVTAIPAPAPTASASNPPAAATPAIARAPSAERTSAAPTPPPSSGASTDRTYVIAILVILAGVVYLVWRRRNRRLILAATAVSSEASPHPSAVLGTARFTQDLLRQLEWRRFEELVAAYYNKTGVQAVRASSGPAAAVHVRISWKGEQRPFALVQCIAQPPGLIDAKPVQALCDVLAAEDIRRGYIVTAGKFGVGARDLAEEKHVTLLSGDIFLEKLNALPDPVRAELLRETTRGDYVTPTCPRCDVKMEHPPGNPDAWQCPQCGAGLPHA